MMIFKQRWGWFVDWGGSWKGEEWKKEGKGGEWEKEGGGGDWGLSLKLKENKGIIHIIFR